MDNYKILIAEDEPDILEVLQYNLEKEGYNVITADNGKEALQLAIKHQPDLILLDIMMPEMDGVEVCREIRAADLEKQAIIAFLTASSISGDTAVPDS